MLAEAGAATLATADGGAPAAKCTSGARSGAGRGRPRTSDSVRREFLPARLADPSFSQWAPQMERFKAAAKTWAEQPARLRRYGCSRCRRNDHGCLACNPEKAK